MTSVEPITHPYAGTFTVRNAAMFLRATTPPPDQPVQLWLRQPKPFVASSRALYTWIRLGMEWQRPVQVTASDRVVSFSDLIRLRMIALFRARAFSYKEIREAEDFARQLTGVPQPFVTEPLWTGVHEIFTRFTAHLIAITKHGQLALPNLIEVLEPAHHGLKFDQGGIADVWIPHIGVLIDPEIQFGAPCVEGTRTETEALWSFHQAGDSAQSLARMYGLSLEQVEAALDWERIVAMAS